MSTKFSALPLVALEYDKCTFVALVPDATSPTGFKNVRTTLPVPYKPETASLSMFFPDISPDETILAYIVMDQKLTLPASMVGSQFRILKAPEGNATVTLEKNGQAIGTILVEGGTGGGNPIFTPTLGTAAAFIVGDTLTVKHNYTKPTGFQGLSMTLNFKV